MRILHVIGGLATDWGGPSRVVREMAAHLAARGHDVTIASTDVGPAGTRVRLGAPGQPDAGPGVRIELHRADVPAPPTLRWRSSRACSAAPSASTWPTCTASSAWR
ncbi:MAG: glycosyltransferase [Myxococcota bacterium]